MKVLAYSLIMIAAALIAAPLPPIPKLHRKVHQVAVSTRSKRLETMAFIAMLADQLRIGAPPASALARSSARHPALGLEIQERESLEQNLSSLRRNASSGAEALLKVALFIDLSSSRGTPLIPALDVIVENIESEIDLEAELMSELAGARATAVLMSVLPILILIALHPYHFIFGTLMGRMAITISIILNLLGRFWLSRITKSALAVTS